MSALLAIHRLEISIAGNRICRGLDLQIDCGSRWAVLGRNGCGKTTLLKTLAGLHPRDAGEITLSGEDLDTIPRARLARMLGILFQEQDTAFPGTVLEAALIGRHPHLAPWRRETESDIELARSALAQVGLANLESRILSTLSGGERQRLAIAALLTQDSELCLLDEPSTHLDLYHQIHTLRILRESTHSGDKALVMVLHDVNLAARFCDHALLLIDPETLLHGPTREVLTEENLFKAYGYPIRRLATEQGEIFSPAWND
ncbi:MAG: ABC transporter ATP-binding protein [Gammaproteobacteria bacterium]|nr:ABC transporter ATP-binding protein [Gammaproteobacteria bacterium]